MKFIACSDIHGQFNRLEKALSELGSMSSDYTFIFLGDYIDRGPQSKEVIELLIDFKAKRPDSKFLLGNHEEFLLCALNKEKYIHKDSILKNESIKNIMNIWIQNGGQATINSYGGIHNIPQSHIQFLIDLELIYMHKKLLFVHAGIDKNKPLSQNTLADFLWCRPPFGLIYENNRIIIHGHTSGKKIIRNNTEQSICIDTCCKCATGKLSMVEFDENAQILNIYEYK